MRITVTSSGILTQYLPANASGNSAQIDIDDDASPVDVMRSLGFPEDGKYLVILNGTLVPTAQRPTQQLAENDELMIMPPLKGG